MPAKSGVQHGHPDRVGSDSAGGLHCCDPGEKPKRGGLEKRSPCGTGGVGVEVVRLSTLLGFLAPVDLAFLGPYLSLSLPSSRLKNDYSFR